MTNYVKNGIILHFSLGKDIIICHVSQCLDSNSDNTNSSSGLV